MNFQFPKFNFFHNPTLLYSLIQERVRAGLRNAKRKGKRWAERVGFVDSDPMTRL
jgi:hypothetical protein